MISSRLVVEIIISELLNPSKDLYLFTPPKPALRCSSGIGLASKYKPVNIIIPVFNIRREHTLFAPFFYLEAQIVIHNSLLLFVRKVLLGYLINWYLAKELNQAIQK